MIHEVAQRARRLARSLIGREKFYSADAGCPQLELGDRNTGFTVNPELLGPDSVVYSFGIGTDISFDIALLDRFSLDVHAFDPTPRSLEWIRRQQLPSKIHIYSYGVADFDGTIRLYPPRDPSHVSFSVVEHGAGPEAECRVYRLRTIMQMLGHTEIDLLKIDIEGCEYSVISDIVSDAIPVRQLCVEFHHWWPEIGVGKTDDAILILRSAGYRISHISPSGHEFSFIRM
jgi:FkbM family methyltransferase